MSTTGRTVGDRSGDDGQISLDLPTVLQRWAVTGQALIARLQMLQQLGTIAELDGGARPGLAEYDAAVEAYLAKVWGIWQHERGLAAQGGGAEGGDRAESPGPAGQPNFVSRLVDDPSSPPSTVLFVGFPGDAAEPGHVRFYVDPGLSAFIEVPDDVVLHARDLPASHSSLGGQYVWVQRDDDVLDQLQRALAHAARLQQQIWTSGGNGDVAGAPTMSPFAAVAGETDDLEPFGAGIDDDDIPLPAGWPTATNS